MNFGYCDLLSYYVIKRAGVLHCRVSRCLYRADHSVIIQLEKGIMQGWPVLLGNNMDKMDSMLRPIIQHHNTCLRDNAEKGQHSGCVYLPHQITQNHKFQLIVPLL